VQRCRGDREQGRGSAEELRSRGARERMRVGGVYFF